MYWQNARLEQQKCLAWPGVSLPPEQKAYVTAAIDYPEILATVLQATAI